MDDQTRVRSENELTAMRDALAAKIPVEQVKRRKVGGGREVDYVPGDVVIARLNAAALEWSLHVTDRWKETLDVNRWNDQVRQNEIVERDCLVLMGEMTIPGLGTRSGMGVQVLEPAAGEDPLKGALTDLEKNCAKKFGVALELYGSGSTGSPSTANQGSTERQSPPSHDGDTYSPMEPTAKQSGLIERRARELSLNADQLNAVCKDATGYSCDDIGKKSASALIERLNELLEDQQSGKSRAGQTPAPTPGTAGTGATDDVTVKRWIKTIAGAKSTAQLDAMQAAIADAGLANNDVIAGALNAAESRLNAGAAEGRPF